MGQKLIHGVFESRSFQLGLAMVCGQETLQKLVFQDAKIRILMARLRPAGLAQIVIERSINKLN